MSSATMIEVKGLCVDYALVDQRLRAVDDVSFSMTAGATLGIAGASGSGKSTVALAMLGLLDRRASSIGGSIRFEGQELLTMRDQDWRKIRGGRIGAVFQWPQGTFNPTMTIGQHLEEMIRLRFGASGQDLKKRAEEALDRVGMPRAVEIMRSYAFELSGGMCQRAAIALALAQEPSLLIADEPTSALDVISQVEICRLLKNLKSDLGLSMLVISHDLGLIGQLADHVAVMNSGKLVESGDVEAVFDEPRHAYTRELLGSAFQLAPARNISVATP